MNSLLENRNAYPKPSWYTPCDTCGAVTAWTRCVQCGGKFELHSRWAKK